MRARKLDARRRGHPNLKRERAAIRPALAFLALFDQIAIVRFSAWAPGKISRKHGSPQRNAAAAEHGLPLPAPADRSGLKLPRLFMRMSSAHAFHAVGFKVGPALDRVQHKFARRAAVAGVDFLAEHHCAVSLSRLAAIEASTIDSNETSPLLKATISAMRSIGTPLVSHWLTALGVIPKCEASDLCRPSPPSSQSCKFMPLV